MPSTALIPAGNPFRNFFDAGYSLLVPIIPPDAALSPRSRLADHPTSRGKAVGYRGHDGLWRGLDWVHYACDEFDLDRWHSMGAGVGIRTGLQPDGTSLHAIDADVTDPGHAVTVRDLIADAFGRLPVRVGRAPKALYLIRIQGALPYLRVRFGEGHAVELLGDGRQFVADGIHPVTLQPYTWPRDIPRFDDIPVVAAGDVARFFDTLKEALPEAQNVERQGTAAERPADQRALAGDPDLVARIVAALPNTDDIFPAREDYIRVMAAIRGSLPGNQALADDLIHQWASRWDGGIHRDTGEPRVNKPAIVDKDIRGLKDKYSLGADYLASLADRVTGSRYEFRAQHLLKPVEASPFATTDTPADLEILSIEDLEALPPPRFIVARHIPQDAVGFIYSDPGVGKSFLALDIALHIAYGLSQWHGDAISTPTTHVFYFALEGSTGLRSRIRAWRHAHPEVAGKSATLHVIRVPLDFMRPEVIERIVRAVKARLPNTAVCLAILDTLSRAMPGADENLQRDMTLFVRACDRIRTELSCSVVAIHHSAKSGDMRGSSVLRGAGDFVFKLERSKAHGTVFLQCEKMKDAPDQWRDTYVLETVSFGLPSGAAEDGAEGTDGMPEQTTSLVARRQDGPATPEQIVAASTADRMLEALAEAWSMGQPWAKSGPRRANRQMVVQFGVTREEADKLLALWELCGKVTYEMFDSDSKAKGYKLSNSGVFG